MSYVKFLISNSYSNVQCLEHSIPLKTTQLELDSEAAPSCSEIKNNFTAAVSVAKSYKSLLFSRQDELRFCQSQHKTHKKLLSSTNNFYLYLLKRLSQVGDGIKHLKIVGTRLR